jgi:hypothetical protein
MTDLTCIVLKPHPKDPMKQEVIRDFLNLPGIAGIALMDGRSRPYFCGLDQILNPQQKVALSQGILQVVGTIPDSFETFEFQFIKHQVYIYKLGHQLTLMVLATGSLTNLEYATAIKRLQTVLQADMIQAVALLQAVADRRFEVDDEPLIAPVAMPPPTPTVIAAPAVTPRPPAATLLDLLAVLNHLSQFTTQYLGTAVVVNYLKTTRPEADWANHFEVERTARITCSLPHPTQPPLHQQEHQIIQTWALAFIKRCSQTIRDFPTIVKNSALSSDQKALLFKHFEP